MCTHVCMWKVVKSSGAAKGVLDKSTLQWHAVINTPRNGPTTKRQRQKIVWNNNRREPLRKLDIKYRINRTKALNDNNPGPWTCEPFNMTWSHKLAYARNRPNASYAKWFQWTTSRVFLIFVQFMVKKAASLIWRKTEHSLVREDTSFWSRDCDSFNRSQQLCALSINCAMLLCLKVSHWSGWMPTVMRMGITK